MKVYGQEILVTINGEPVTEAEFVFHMKQQRALIYGHFFTNYDSEPGSAFWTTTYSGNTPLEAIKDSTIQRLTDIKIHLLMARELGIIEEISFEAFQISLEAENRRRREAVRKEQVIYGPRGYSEETYFAFWYSNLLIEVKKAWEMSRYDVSGSKENFIRDQVPADSNGKHVKDQYPNYSFEDYTDSLIAGASVDILFENMDEILLKYLK